MSLETVTWASKRTLISTTTSQYVSYDLFHLLIPPPPPSFPSCQCNLPTRLLAVYDEQTKQTRNNSPALHHVYLRLSYSYRR